MRALRTSLVLTLSASLALGPVAMAAAPAAPAAPAATASTEIKIGNAADFSRIEFHGAQPRSARREGSALVLKFGRTAPPDITRLKVSPPRHLTKVDAVAGPDGFELRLEIEEGAEAKLGKDGASTYVNLAVAKPAAPTPAEAAPKRDQPPPERPNPVPASGVVRMQPELQGANLQLKFPWRARLGASVFRRGDAIWMVFDAPAKLDLSLAPRGMPQMRRMEAVQGAAYTAVRITAPMTTVASASAEGGLWTLTLGPTSSGIPEPVKLSRDEASGPAALTAQVAGATGVFWVDDPVVGDRITAVTALPPAKSLADGRAYVDAVLLPSAQGLAVQPRAEDLEVIAEGDLVRIGRPKGLALSPASVQARGVTAPVGLPQPTSMPALIDFVEWSKTGEEGFLKRYAHLLDLASAENEKGKGAGFQARLALARFLIGSELAHEGVGVLDMIGKADQTMMSDPEFRGLRGSARAMAGRLKDAQADFSAPVLADDPSSALWRGYVAARLGDYSGAREQFAIGRSALALFAPKWKVRFARADAEAALAAGDVGAARNALFMAQSETAEPTEMAAVQLTQAKLLDATGETDKALGFYDQVAKLDYGALASPALLRATEIRLNRGQLQAKDAVATLDSLRFRWRGDATELETIRALGRIYLAQGHYREALDALRSAGRRMPDLPAAVGVSADLATAFKALFLTGGADGLQPIQALALFYDFRELTPIGADGDFMVRKLARRLVDVDLLDQAAELLKYQAENRLDGVARAEVASDLAMIQIMNRKPEQALIALNSSRTTLLPNALNAERRVLEARALAQLGRYDHALELLGKDTAVEAAELKAEIAWKQREWPLAGQMLEARLGDRWKLATPLNADEETKLLRAGAAYSLAGDDKALERLRTRYANLTDGVRSPEAMRVALSGAETGALTAADFVRAASDADALAGWVSRMKKKFREKPAPVGKPPVQAAAKPAAAPAGIAAQG